MRLFLLFSNTVMLGVMTKMQCLAYWRLFDVCATWQHCKIASKSIKKSQQFQIYWSSCTINKFFEKLYENMLTMLTVKITEKSHSTLRAKRATFTFWVDKSSLKVPKIVHFGEFLKTWSFRSNSVTRHVTFNRTKIGGKCQNSNATFWGIFKQCERGGIIF